MKKLFLLIFAVLLVLGSALPLASYRVTRLCWAIRRLCPQHLLCLSCLHRSQKTFPPQTPRPFWWRISPPER